MGAPVRLTSSGLVTGGTAPGVLCSVSVTGTAAGVAIVKEGGSGGAVLVSVATPANDFRQWLGMAVHSGALYVVVPASCEVTVVIG